MESLFSIGDRIVCVDSSDSTNHLIEGKTYNALGVDVCRDCGKPTVNVGVGVVNGFWHQDRFVPLDFDEYTNEAVRESLNESIKVKL